VGAALVAVLSIGAGSALAVPIPGTLDQEQTIVTAQSATLGSVYTQAQTFTAGQTGTLEAIGIYVGAAQAQIAVRPAADPTADLYGRVGVASASGGIPSGPYLMNQTYTTFPGEPDWIYFILPTPASITAGAQYSIIATVSGLWQLAWAGHCATDNYAGGSALIFDSSKPSPAWQTMASWGADLGWNAACQQDFGFKTFITAAAVETTAPTLIPFESFQGATTTPGTTPPPTGTTPPGDGDSTPGFLLVFAALAAGAAFVTVRRFEAIRR
jgi:hypothetical protein